MRIEENFKNLSPEGKSLLQKLEGTKLKAYKDVAGVWTIGNGHTKGVKKGDVISEGQAGTLLDLDIEKFESIVRTAVWVPLSQPQFDALVIFAFNTGRVGQTMAKKLNAGDFEGAADEFLKWIYITDPVSKQKIPSPGLINRRAAEEALFRA